MPSLIEVSWLIPAFPLAGGLVIAIFLLSFGRTMNRLTKPVSLLIINSIIFSTLFSGILLYKNLSGSILYRHIHLLSLDFDIALGLDPLKESFAIGLGLIMSIIILVSYLRLPRKKGYVRYVTSLSVLCGLLFLLILGSDLAHPIL